jgi:hypothetical protein
VLLLLDIALSTVRYIIVKRQLNRGCTGMPKQKNFVFAFLIPVWKRLLGKYGSGYVNKTEIAGMSNTVDHISVSGYLA